jgi:hypothetical protein
MQIAYSPYALLPFIALVAALVLMIRVWQYRTRPIARTFFMLMLALAEWSLAAVMEHISLELAAKVFWVKMTYLGITAMPVAWLIFTLQYSDREKWLTRRNIAMLTILPVATLIVVWTNNIHHLMWKDIWLDTSVYVASESGTIGPLKIADTLRAMPLLPGGFIIMPSNF